MSTSAPDYKKAVADVVYHSAVVCLGAVASSYGWEKTKIAAWTELKFDMKNGEKLLVYLVFGKGVSQMVVDKNWILASLVPNN